MLIKNSSELGYTPLRRCALDIIETGIKAVLPSVVLPSAIAHKPYNGAITINERLHPIGKRVFVIGGGKASGAMAEAFENILPESIITDGIVICKDDAYNTRKIRVFPAGHPIPDNRGECAVKEILSLRDSYRIGEGDTVFCLLSGGGSALMPYPSEGITLSDKQLITDLLISSGAKINEINMVRKHLSRVKGGGLGHYFAPAQVITLIISDVIGNDLSTIASGPTHPDPTTFNDALNVLDRYHIIDQTPGNVIDHFQKGIAGKIPETSKYLYNCHNYIIADSSLALKAMRRKAGELGFIARIVTSQQNGETAGVARQIARDIINGQFDNYDALIFGGETTPILPEKHGTGGRNQHFVCVSMLELKDFGGEWVVTSLGTDGSDFIPDVAGAIVDNKSWQAARDLSIDVISYIKQYDSHALLKLIGGCLIVTGNTGTNVGDIMLYLLKK